MSGTPPVLDMKSILSDRSNRVVVCCGAGGVGKTTTAAAMGGATLLPHMRFCAVSDSRLPVGPMMSMR